MGEVYNSDFNSTEFEGFKNEAGLNRFVLSVKQWTEKNRYIIVLNEVDKRKANIRSRKTYMDKIENTINTLENT